MQPHLIVFTDLDGTLLDHHSYSWRAASPAMAKLAANGIPLIFNSSKTAAEMRHLQNAMGIRAPFIVENGAAAVIPAGCLGRTEGRRPRSTPVCTPATLRRGHLSEPRVHWIALRLAR